MNLMHKTNRSNLVIKPQTREKMVRVFKGRFTGDKLLAQRYASAHLGFCVVIASPFAIVDFASCLKVQCTGDKLLAQR